MLSTELRDGHTVLCLFQNAHDLTVAVFRLFHRISLVKIPLIISVNFREDYNCIRDFEIRLGEKSEWFKSLMAVTISRMLMPRA